MLFSLLLVTTVRCHNLCWRICRTLLHLLLTGAALGCIIFKMVTEYKDLFDPSKRNSIPGLNATHIFRLHLLCLVSHFLLGFLVLPTKELGPKLFSPLILVLIRFLRKVGSADCFLKGQDVITAFLNEAEYGRVGGKESEEAEDEDENVYQGKLTSVVNNGP
jgi:hypothetical protein